MNVKILFKERLLRESFFSGWSSGGVRNVVLHVSLCGQVLFSPAKGEYCICSIALESCCEGWREVSYVVREALKSCADRRCFWFVLHIWMLMVAWVHYLLSSVLFSTQSWYPHFWSFKLWFPHLSVLLLHSQYLINHWNLMNLFSHFHPPFLLLVLSLRLKLSPFTSDGETPLWVSTDHVQLLEALSVEASYSQYSFVAITT